MDQKDRIFCSKTVQEDLKIVVDFARFYCYSCRGAHIYISELTGMAMYRMRIGWNMKIKIIRYGYSKIPNISIIVFFQDPY